MGLTDITLKYVHCPDLLIPLIFQNLNTEGIPSSKPHDMTKINSLSLVWLGLESPDFFPCLFIRINFNMEHKSGAAINSLH